MAVQLRVRVTGVLMERGRLLLTRRVNAASPDWRVPETLVNVGESLGQAVVRAIATQTGYPSESVRLLYLADDPEAATPELHAIFECRKLEGGRSGVDPSGPPQVPDWEVRWVSTGQLTDVGLSQTFANLMTRGLPDAGTYVGADCNLGI